MTVWTKEIQQVTRSEISDWRGSARILWVAINSSYYFGTFANRFMEVGDIAGYANHAFHNNTKVCDVPELLTSTTNI